MSGVSADVSHNPAGESGKASPPSGELVAPPLAPGLSIAALVYNRREALRRTLTELRGVRELVQQQLGWPTQLIVADNASSDHSGAMVRDEFPDVELVALTTNSGVAGFNASAAKAMREFVLITDDDSWPDGPSLVAALKAMRDDASVGGVMLHRRHPRSGEVEWPGDGHSLAGVQRHWPDMGCLNLVRTASWRAVGGYEERFFLYRNDTDLALKLLAKGDDVLFDPSWFGWHDSPYIAKKSERWFRLSTRNWVWMARRHGRGGAMVHGAVLGWLRAHQLAGGRAKAHAAALRGFVEGVLRPAPRLPSGLKPNGNAWRRLISLKLGLRN